MGYNDSKHPTSLYLMVVVVVVVVVVHGADADDNNDVIHPSSVYTHDSAVFFR